MTEALEIVFCMEGFSKEKFSKLSGVGEMTDKFENSGWTWKYINLAKYDEKERIEDIKGRLYRNTVIVTNNSILAQGIQEAGICCIGYQEEQDSRFFKGAEFVLTSFEEPDPTFFANALRRFQGITAVIAETDRLVVRESCEEDFASLYRISRENDINCYAETMSENYEEEKEKFLAYTDWAYNYFGYGLWTVLEKKTGAVIGRCGLNPVTDDISPQGRIELGYLIGKDYRRRGYAWEACLKILEYGFETLECPVVFASIHRENFPSQALAKKLGFRKEPSAGTGQEIELWKKTGESGESRISKTRLQ